MCKVNGYVCINRISTTFYIIIIYCSNMYNWYIGCTLVDGGFELVGSMVMGGNLLIGGN